MAKSMKSFLHPTEGHYRELMTDSQYDGLRIVENEFGLKGYAVFWKLMEKICGSSEGYCIKWNDRVGELFAADIRTDYSLVRNIVTRLISVGVFDKALFEKHGLLTASFIQENWTAVKKRSYEIDEAYRLIKCTQVQNSVCKKGQIASKKGQNVCKTPPNLTELNLTECNERQTEPRNFSAVSLSDDERAELVRLSDSLSVEAYIKKIISWQQENKRMCSKPFITIRNWIKEDKSKPSKQKPRKETSYDLDEWEEFAINFDPGEGGRK